MNDTTNQLPTIYVDKSAMLQDSDQWQFRFEVQSATSDNVYIVSQNKKKRHWGCSCMSYRRYRQCKHLQALGLPVKERPYEVNIIER